MMSKSLYSAIRFETADDIEAIHQLTKQAFLQAPHTDHTEQFIVDALRKAGVLSISLVAENEQGLVGHVAISPVSISDGANGWYGLGPISVLPNMQSKGVGSQLMQQALVELKKLGAHGCVLLGDPNYYQRFGFQVVAGLQLEGVPPEYFQALSFNSQFPQGLVTYHGAFSATE